MSQKNIQLTFFIFVTVCLFVLSFFIFKPYFGVIFLSSVLAVSFYPLYIKILNWLGGRKSTASLITVLIIVFCIIIPVLFLFTQLLKEAIDLYNDITFNGSQNIIIREANVLVLKIQSLFQANSFSVSDLDLQSYTRNSLSWIIGHFDSIFAVVFGGIFNFVLMILSMYYMFINGERIKKNLIAWSPLPDSYDEEFLNTLYSSVDAVIKGRILVAMAQGLFLGIGFAIFGVGGPVLWGFVGGIASLVPMLGTSVIVIPAVIFLFLKGSVYPALGLLAWGIFCVGLIDNVLSFLFLKNKIKIHPLIILFSIIGGVEMFGAIGFLVGPVAVSAFMSLMRIYPFIISQVNKKSEQ